MADITILCPPPLSVNRTRKIDWCNHKRVKEWLRQADALFLTQKRGLPPPILGRYEIIITLQYGSRLDADNAAKSIIDLVRRFGLVTNDDFEHMRRVTIEFGDVPEGCRVTLREFTDGEK